MIDRREEILKTLRATPVVLQALVRDIGKSELRHRPAPGEWAVIEVVGHIADTEERALGRMRIMIAEDDPWLEPFDQVALAEERRYIDLDLNGELDRFGRLRQQHVAELQALEDAAWERTGRHGEHGKISIELYEVHVAAEEVDHLAQISRALVSPDE